MQTVTITQLIDADLETVWAQIADLTLISDWHPSVESADLLSESPQGLGATRQCNFYDGSDVREEIIEAADPHSFRLLITGLSGPMKRLESQWSARATAQGTTKVTVIMAYEMKYGLLGAVMNQLVVRRRMPKLLGKVLAGLDRHVAGDQPSAR